MEADLARIPLAARGEVTQPWPAPARRWPRVRWITVAVVAVLLALSGAVGSWWEREHRWDYSREVSRLVEQGDKLEWQDDTKRTLTNAAQAYEKALTLDPGNPLIQAQLAALLARIETLYLEGQRKKIQTLAAAALTKAPDHPMPWIAQAKLLLLENKPEEAELAARKAIELDSEFDRGYTLLGEALFAQGKRDASFDEFRRSTEVGQGYERARLVFAAKLYEVGKYNEAAVEFQKILDYRPGHLTAEKGLGDAYLAQDLYSEAIPLFKEVFGATQDSRAADSLGNAYFGLNRFDEAIKAFTVAHELNPHPLTARNLAEAYEKKGQTREAQNWYKRALDSFDDALAKGSPRARANTLSRRAYCAAKLGHFDEAFGNVKEALGLIPNTSAFLFRAAQVSAMAGRREEVYSWMRRAVKAGYPRGKFRSDFVFHDFQDDPRFLEILESATQ
jgi:tetratricopeptide (TPR) repeat protein